MTSQSCGSDLQPRISELIRDSLRLGEIESKMASIPDGYSSDFSFGFRDSGFGFLSVFGNRPSDLVLASTA